LQVGSGRLLPVEVGLNLSGNFMLLYVQILEHFDVKLATILRQANPFWQDFVQAFDLFL